VRICDAGAVLQVYELARDELLRIAAILRMVDLANEGDETAQSFCEILGKSVVYHDDETRTWSAGILLRKFERATSEREKSSTVIDLMEALKRRSSEIARASARASEALSLTPRPPTIFGDACLPVVLSDDLL
jgi:hypothetical protein